MSQVKVNYVPATNASRLPRGSRMMAFDAFLLSPQMRRPVRQAAEEIAGVAVGLYLAEAFETGELAESVDVEDGVMVINTFPRVSCAVTANGGIPARMETEYSVAAIAEFGTSQRAGLRILGRAGAPYDSPRGEVA